MIKNQIGAFMREIEFDVVVKAVKDMIMHCGTDLPQDTYDALEKAMEEEKSPVSKEVIRQLLENANIAKDEKRPLCQDTGLAVFFVNVGEEVRINGGLLRDAINKGTEQGYTDGYLRASTCEPFSRLNLKDKIGYNLPAIIHFDIVAGDKIDIEYAAKGGGSENVSRARVFPPAAGKDGIVAYVKEVISDAGGNPCPPITVGVGIGGTFEKACISSKHALFRDLETTNPDPEMAELEARMLTEINNLGIGAMGMGGTKTALAVHIEANPCHIASLPVSVNVQCHSSRHTHITI
jgi:fumarate hydratase subunit alpha